MKLTNQTEFEKKWKRTARSTLSIKMDRLCEETRSSVMAKGLHNSLSDKILSNAAVIYERLGWHQRTARRVALYTVVIVLCTKLDAECDRQATVVGRLLTTLYDDRGSITKLFLVQRLKNSSGGIMLMYRDIQISHACLFDKYSRFKGFCP